MKKSLLILVSLLFPLMLLAQQPLYHGTFTGNLGGTANNPLGSTNISNIGGTNLLMVLTPEMFSCKGDGVTDDTANFQKFANAVRNFIIAGLNVEGHCVPTVSYLISGPITNCCPINLKGKAVQWRSGSLNQSTTLLLSGSTAGLVSTNTGQNTGFKLEDFSISSTAQAAGMIGVYLFSSGSLGNQAVDLKNVSFYNLDKGIVMTNCDEININQAVFYHCTNGIISDQGAVAAIQANLLNNVRCNTWGTALILGNGQYSVENLDTSPNSDVNNVYLRLATVSLKNCNIENASETSVHFNVVCDHSTVTCEGGNWAIPAGLPSVLLTNMGEIHFTSAIQLGNDVNGYQVRDADTSPSQSTSIGQLNGGVKVTNSFTTYAFDGSKLVYNLNAIPIDWGSGVGASAGTVDTLKWDESNSHAFWNGLDAGFVYNNAYFFEDILEFNRIWKHNFTASYPSVNLTVSTVTASANAPTAGFTGNGSGLTNMSFMTPTNFISGRWYTNSSGKNQFVFSTVQMAIAAVTGQAGMQLWCSNAIAPVPIGTISFPTTASTGTTPAYMQLFGVVTNLQVYTFTNQSSGANNSVSLLAGSGFILTVP